MGANTGSVQPKDNNTTEASDRYVKPSSLYAATSTNIGPTKHTPFENKSVDRSQLLLHPQHLVPDGGVLPEAPTREPLDERPPALLRELHMLALARLEAHATRLVELPEPDPVVRVQRLEAHGHHDLLVVPAAVAAVGRGVRAEPGGLLRDDGLVSGEEDEDEGVERGEVRGVRRVRARGDLVVDRGEEGGRV